MSETPKPRIPVNDIQLTLISNYRAALHRHDSALRWIASDVERINLDRERSGYSTHGGQSLVDQASTLASAQAEISSLIELAKVAFKGDEGAFWSLVNHDARPDYEISD